MTLSTRLHDGGLFVVTQRHRTSIDPRDLELRTELLKDVGGETCEVIRSVPAENEAEARSHHDEIVATLGGGDPVSMPSFRIKIWPERPSEIRYDIIGFERVGVGVFNMVGLLPPEWCDILGVE